MSGETIIVALIVAVAAAILAPFIVGAVRRRLR